MVSMSDDQQKSQNFATDVPERPLNPTTNAADLLGDTTGMTGVTQGSPQQTSAEPTANVQDDSGFQGAGILSQQTNPTGIPKEAVSDRIYDQNTSAGMSHVASSAASDTASEPAKENNSNDTTQTSPSLPNQPQAFGKQSPSPFPTTQDASYIQIDNEGEQDAAGGTTPDPRSDDDSLEMAQQAGFQPDEDEEHPQPLDAARDIDIAEQAIKSS